MAKRWKYRNGALNQYDKASTTDHDLEDINSQKQFKTISSIVNTIANKNTPRIAAPSQHNHRSTPSSSEIHENHICDENGVVKSQRHKPTPESSQSSKPYPSTTSYKDSKVRIYYIHSELLPQISFVSTERGQFRRKRK